MFRPRVIPVLLLRNKGLVKSIKFKKHQYIGDPINAVKIFNDLRADELVFLDISASKDKRTVSPEFVKKVGEEANMPFAVGGGIKTIEEIQKIIAAGAEKVVLNTTAVYDPNFIRNASKIYGASTIVVCIDYKKGLFGKNKVCFLSGSKSAAYSPVDFAILMEQKGAGEIILQSIDRDGTMTGYDLDLIKKVSEAVSIPVVALGGAGNLEHLQQAFSYAHALGLAAGSIFVYHGHRKGILINYPDKQELSTLF